MITRKWTSTAALALFATTSNAGELNTPNEFQSGTPAVAAEVNANFDAVEAAVNDNDARISELEGSMAGVPVVDSKMVVLQDGLAGYSGTEDTTLTKDETVWNSLGIVGEQPTAQVFAGSYDQAMTTDVAVGLLRFDLTGLTDDMIEGAETCDENIEVMDATLLLRGTVTNQRIVYLTMVDPDAPRWVEAEATWTQSDAGSNWPAGTNTETPVFNSLLLGFSETREGWANSIINQTLFFSLNTDFVKQWVCDDSKNKGLAIRQSGGTSKFISSDFPRVPPRPKLKLILQRM